MPPNQIISTTVEEDSFGNLYLKNEAPKINPTCIRRFTITNKNKISVQVITYGAAITSIKVPDKHGNLDDIVLGFDDVKGYVNHQHYFGATIGRCANRIANARFQIRDRVYRLDANNGNHHLHGGHKGFDKVVWDSLVEGDQVVMSHLSPGGEGYPGWLMARVTYSLTDQDELRVEYQASSSHPTPVNLTNHGYFNLAGHQSQGSIKDHHLSINADAYTPVSDSLIPTGEVLPVAGTIYDFREPVRLGDRLANGGGYDTNFCISGEAGKERLAAKLRHPPSGRVMEVSSTQHGLQLYTANFLPECLPGKAGAFYCRHGAVCLETQNYPDAVNKPNFPPCIITSKDKYLQRTTYKFYLE